MSWPTGKLMINDTVMREIESARSSSSPITITIPLDYKVEYSEFLLSGKRFRQVIISTIEADEVDESAMIWVAVAFGFRGNRSQWSVCKEPISKTRSITSVIQLI